MSDFMNKVKPLMGNLLPTITEKFKNTQGNIKETHFKAASHQTPPLSTVLSELSSASPSVCSLAIASKYPQLHLSR